MKTLTLLGHPSNMHISPRDPAAGNYAADTACCPQQPMHEATPGVQTCAGCDCAVVLDNNDTVNVGSSHFRRITAVHVCPAHH
jgi:hypothetical protein